MREPLLTEKEAAEWLGLAPATLAGMRRKGTGPGLLAVSVGDRAVRYEPERLERYVEEQRVPPTDAELMRRFLGFIRVGAHVTQAVVIADGGPDGNASVVATAGLFYLGEVDDELAEIAARHNYVTRIDGRWQVTDKGQAMIEAVADATRDAWTTEIG